MPQHPSPKAKHRRGIYALEAYIGHVAGTVGIGSASVCVATEPRAASAYLALDRRATSFPDIDVALLWDNIRGWSVALETASGDLVALDYLGPQLLPVPEQVAGFVDEAITREYPGNRQAPEQQPAKIEHLAERLCAYLPPVGAQPR